MGFFTILLNIIVGLVFILAFIGFLMSDKTESYDYMRNYFGLPKEYDIPDEITIEIVKEDSPQQEDSQTSTLAKTLKETEQASLLTSSSKQTKSYVPE